MGILYAEKGKIYCNDYMEIYIPMQYFNDGNAINNGTSIETFGILYTKAFPNGSENELKLWNIPTAIHLMIYGSKDRTIKIHNKNIDVLALEYPKGSYIMHQSIPRGREIANMFLNLILAGKVPNTISYQKIIDIWWKNLEISGVSLKVPSKIYEMIIATIYRNPNNLKERYGQRFAKQSNPSGLDYESGNVRSVVKDLSTFSGMVFEDIGTMISNGINNSLEGNEEPISPLEKIIYY